MRIRRMTAPPDVREVDEKIAEVRLKKEESAIDAQDFERAASCVTRSASCSRSASAASASGSRRDGRALRGGRGGDRRGPATWTGIPVFKLTEEETEKLLRMEDELHKRIISQEDSIKAVSKAIRRTRAGLKDPGRPARSSSSGPRASGRPSSPRRSPSSCSATRTR